MTGFRSSLFAIAIALTLHATASADPQVEDIAITFHTGVQIAATKGDARVYDVSAGANARFTIVAT